MKQINYFLWIITIIVIIFNAFYFSIKLKFPQFNIKLMLKSLKSKDVNKGISVKETLFMSLASKIGTGSLAGIAFCIYYGGVGCIFWIWIISFFLAINAFLENYLALKYKEKDGIYYKGGPSFYIKNGLNKKKLAMFYSVVVIFSYICGFLTIQNNTICTLFYDTYKIDPFIISIIISILSFIIICKGLKSISKLCEKIVPFMCIIYLIIGLIILIINFDKLGYAFSYIIKSAFNIKSFTSGVLGSLFIIMQKSIFASEAGLGTGAIASGATSSNNYVKQGFIGVVSTYFINIVITTITGLIIILSNYKSVYFSNINGIEITNYAFNYHLGHFGEVMLLILILLFAFSTIITGYYYGESNLKLFTSNSKIIFLLKIFTCIILFIGGVSSSTYVWSLVNIFIAILALVNIYAIFKLKDKVNL